MEREQFTFHASFARAIGRIKDKDARCDAYEAIVTYALTGELPDMDELPDAAAGVFEIARMMLDDSRRKSEYGKLGGRPSAKKQSESTLKASFSQPEKLNESTLKACFSESASKPQANASNPEANESKKQGETESKDIIQDNGDKGNKDINNNINNKNNNKDGYYSSPPVVPPTQLSPADLFTGDLLSAVEEWLTYKAERREKYKPTGANQLLRKIQNSASLYGDAAVAEVIRSSMASNYQGIVFDRLPQRREQAPARSSNPFLNLLREEGGE